MNRRAVTLCVVSGLLILSPVAIGQLRKWNQKMQALAKIFSELLPELVESEPPTAATRKRLERSTKQMLELAHTINMGPDTKGNPLPPEPDPTIGFVSSIFEREMKHAYRTLQAGHVDYAKTVLRQMTGYCIACHTRHDRGPDFPTIAAPEKTSSMTPFERAELFAAIRQFDRALDEFEKIISDPEGAKRRQIEWGRSLRHAFTIAIRVKKDPERALAIADRALSMEEAPSLYRE